MEPLDRLLHLVLLLPLVEVGVYSALQTLAEMVGLVVAAHRTLQVGVVAALETLQQHLHYKVTMVGQAALWRLILAAGVVEEVLGR
jgi:hypothetical protein